jgi:hypothetical protein
VETLSVFALAALTLAAAVYAHYRIPFHTPSATSRWAARLLVTGVAFGYAMTIYYGGAGRWVSLLLFLSGFGLVHVPAAFILFLKQQRASG